MKNKKKILSLIACLSLLSSCNKTAPNSSSCSITTSTPASSVTPEPDVINPFDYANFITYNYEGSKVFDKTIKLQSFSDELTDEMKLKIEEIHIPEQINGINLTVLNNPENGLFYGFNNLKRIYIPKTLISVGLNTTDESKSSTFINLPSLENIIVDKENQVLYSSGNCLIQRNYTTNRDTGELEYDDKSYIVCGFKDVVIPDQIADGVKITEIRDYAFSNNKSITSIKINPSCTTINSNSLKNVSDSLSSVDVSNNENFVHDEINHIITSKNNKKILYAYGDVTITDDYVNDNIYSSSKSFSMNNFNNVTGITFNTNKIYVFANNAFRNSKIRRIKLPASLGKEGNSGYAVTSNPFTYMDYLEEIDASENDLFYVKNNVLYTSAKQENGHDRVIACYKDAILEEGVTYLVNSAGVFAHSSLTSISFPSTMTTLPSFESINRNRNYEDYCKIDLSRNEKFKWKGNNIVTTSGDEEKVLYAFPDKDGNIVLPETATIFQSFVASYNDYKDKIKSIKFNEGLKSLETINTLNFFSYYNKITEIELPSTIEKIVVDGSNYRTPFWLLSKIEKLTIKGGENAYYKTEGNCLIKKGKTDNLEDDPTKDSIIYAWNDVKIPEYITSLSRSNGIFTANYSIRSIEIHNNLKEINDSVFISLPYNSRLLINYVKFNGTLEEMKKTLKNNSNETSLYKELTYAAIEDLKIKYLSDDRQSEITKTSYDLVKGN